jgi:hypothetical protein
LGTFTEAGNRPRGRSRQDIVQKIALIFLYQDISVIHPAIHQLFKAIDFTEQPRNLKIGHFLGFRKGSKGFEANLRREDGLSRGTLYGLNYRRAHALSSRCIESLYLVK